MKKIKILAMIMTVVILVTSLNLGMMFTSFAVSVSSIEDIRSAVNSTSQGGTVEIYINADIDGSSLGAVAPIDATGKTVKIYGQNRLIQNVTFNGGGLFSKVGDGSEFSNLGLYNCYITDFTADGNSGYGFLAGTMPSGKVSGCFADGTITVYGSPSRIGGLVGSFGGTMDNSFAMTDIYTDGSYVGGLIGEFTGEASAESTPISYCYSTGSIDNDGRSYIGGLIGYSSVSCVKSSYTSTCILNPYADTVKAVGVIEDLSDTVYYDKNISLQRQGDNDVNRCTPAELAIKLNTGNWGAVTGYYPQLSVFFTSSNPAFCSISAISAAVVDIDRSDKYTTGREFTVVSSTTDYSFATLTNYGSTASGGVLTEVNTINWRISGGVDEYYFDPSTANENSFPTNSSSVFDGLSGNTFDTRTGKYLFVNTGDVRFTAYSGIYERDIYVHVTTADKNPYIVGGNGTKTSPFSVDSVEEFDKIRLYCLDGSYYYNLNVDLDMSKKSPWTPIVGMKGTLAGNGHIISNLNVTKANEGGAGLFATVSATATISDIHISNAQINPEAADCAGILAGKVTNAAITNVMATGTVTGAKNGGMIAGEAYGSTALNKCLTMGHLTSSDTAGGIFGVTGKEENDTVSSVDCYSTAVVMGAKAVGGFYGSGNGKITTSVFTGMLSPGLNGLRYGLTGGDVTNITNSYFDMQSTGIFNEGSHGKTTAELTTSGGVTLNSNWSRINNGYPQLTVFSGSDDSVTKLSSHMSALKLDYSYSYGNASSMSFASAAFNKSYIDLDGSAAAPSVYGEGSQGYSVSGPNETTGVYTFTNVSGGMQMYQLKESDTTKACDTRYLLFNVKSVNVYYKFTFIDEKGNSITSDYNTEMSNRGLTDFTTELGAEFGAILDSSVTDYTEWVTISPSSEALSIDMVLADARYSYVINAYGAYDTATKTTSQPLTVYKDNTVSLGTLNNIYIDFIIITHELPWGIYNIDCN